MRDFRDWCLHYFPGGSFSGDTYSCKNVFRQEKRASLTITERNQKWFDHGTGEGGDIRFFCHEHGIEAWAGVEPWKESLKRKDAPEPDVKPTEAEAVTMWEGSVPVESHPYLTKKGLSGEGLRTTTKEWRHSDGKATPAGTLLIPARDIDGVLHGVERILPDGKLHLGRKTRCFFGDAPEPGKFFLLAEGFATACAIRRLSGWPTAEAFGFACLENAAKAVTERHPGIEVVLCPDRVNEETQRAVVTRMKEKWTVLELPDESPKNHDWDDEVRQYGLEAAKENFRARWSLARAKEPDVTVERKPRYELVRIGDIELVEPEYLVAGLIEDKTLGMFFGASGSMKSFLALDLAACVATGLPFHGRQVKEGPVIYLAGEGFNGIKRRLTAWELNTGVSLKDVPLYISRRAPTLANRESAKDVAESIRDIAETAGHPALICIDTVARATVGADENSNSDMGEFIETVDEIRHEHDCALLTVHHSGLADKDRGRGASAIHAALDVEYQVTKDGTSVTLLNKKMKDGAEPEPIHFQATEITVGQARNGDPITSVVLEEAEDGPRERKKPLTPAQKLGLDTFMIAAEKAGTLGKDGAFVGLHVDDWRPFFYERHTADNVHAKSVAFARARERLVARGDISVENDYYRLSGAMAILEKSIVEKLKESGSHKSQASHMCSTCDSSQGEGESHTVTHPFRGVTCDSPVTSENDVVPSGEVEKEPVILFPRGSLEKHASRSGVPVELIRESLKPLLESGRIVLSGNDIYENPARPNVEDPSEAIEDDGQEEDAPPPGPKSAEAPECSPSRGEDPGLSPRAMAPGAEEGPLR